MAETHHRRKVTISSSEQGNISRRKALEITSAVFVCRVKSGIRIAHSIQFFSSDEMLAGKAVAPPKDVPSRSNHAILIDSIFAEVSPSSNPARILNSL